MIFYNSVIDYGVNNYFNHFNRFKHTTLILYIGTMENKKKKNLFSMFPTFSILK